ncbi:hypothetical protein FKW77_009149 [Venturia effusa]|uniref:Uncharacterized protein n=1 Tax=Venturia effusa TaxID=50376 RepID=A0A517LG72_9PEZI|nr:hypothetical protein FKW77_009149 [Venturia effusa]
MHIGPATTFPVPPTTPAWNQWRTRRTGQDELLVLGSAIRGGEKRKGGKVERWMHDLMDEENDVSATFGEDDLLASLASDVHEEGEAKCCNVICKVDGVNNEGFSQIAYLGAPGAASTARVATRP